MTLAGTRKERRLLIDSYYNTRFLMYMAAVYNWFYRLFLLQSVFIEVITIP